MLRLLDLNDAHTIGRQICLCLSVGSVPVVMASEDLGMKLESFLPFNQVLEWRRALIQWRMGLSEVNIFNQHQVTESLTDFLSISLQSELKRRLENIPEEKLLELRRVGHRIFWHYMSSPDAILDTTVAVARQLLNRPVPLHSSVTPNGTHYLQRGKSEDESDELESWTWSRSQSFGFSWQENFDRWNVEFFPWQRIPVENPSE